MNRYTVTIEYNNGRKNSFVIWADNEETAKKLAMRSWGNPSMYRSIDATRDNY